MDQPKTDFEKIRAQAQAINRIYGGKLNVKEWDSGTKHIFKVVLLWETPNEQSRAA